LQISLDTTGDNRVLDLRFLSKETVIYISGPMTGYDELNYPAFHEVAKKYRELGFFVINPAENPDGMEYHEYMLLATGQVIACDLVAQLSGWEKSKGAIAEYALARSIGRQFYTIR